MLCGTRRRAEIIGKADAMAQFLGAWRVDLFVAVNLLLAAAWYLWAVRRVNAATRGPVARGLPRRSCPEWSFSP